MPFNENELIPIIKGEGLTDLEIAVRVGICERKLRSIKNTFGRKPTSENELNFVLTELVELPWSEDAHAQVRYMTNLIRSSRWNDLYQHLAFSSKTSVEKTLELDLTSPVSSQDWGHALVAYHFQLGMELSTLGKHAESRSNWEDVVNTILKLLEGREENWAKILRFKVAGNRVVIAWKRATGNDRASVAMKQLIDDVGYREKLIAFNDLVPKDPVAPFNALAIASRFGEREHYQDLLARLKRANPEFDPDPDPGPVAGHDPDFDEDFDDFRDWYKKSMCKDEEAA